AEHNAADASAAPVRIRGRWEKPRLWEGLRIKSGRWCSVPTRRPFRLYWQSSTAHHRLLYRVLKVSDYSGDDDFADRTDPVTVFYQSRLAAVFPFILEISLNHPSLRNRCDRQQALPFTLVMRVGSLTLGGDNGSICPM